MNMGVVGWVDVNVNVVVVVTSDVDVKSSFGFSDLGIPQIIAAKNDIFYFVVM